MFQTFCHTIKWRSVDKEQLRKARAFAQFLTTNCLHIPKSWRDIEASLPQLGPTERKRTLMIRQCLRDVGNYLEQKGQLEIREQFIINKRIANLLDEFPASTQHLVSSYREHLDKTKHRVTGIIRRLEVLAAFVDWCHESSIVFPYGVQAAHIKSFLLTLFDQWRCPHCGWCTPFHLLKENKAKPCQQCGSTEPPRLTSGKSFQTVRLYHSHLKVFFLWAKLTRHVVSNPVRGVLKSPKQILKHYDRSIIIRLLDYVQNPQADPFAAFALYLIICHLLTVREIRHARLLSLANKSHPVRKSLVDAYGVYVPPPKVSRGNHSPGRPNPWVHFPLSASKWLKPLLSRFEESRRETCPDTSNDYLFVAPNRCRYSSPVSSTFIWELVGLASKQTLEMTCRPKLLRTTAAILLVDHTDAAVLRAMGWKGQQANLYSYAQRVTVNPKSSGATSALSE